MTDEQELFDTVGVDEDELIDPGDMAIGRDSDGDLLPKSTDVNGADGVIIHFPMSRGDRDEYLPPDMNLMAMSPESKATMLNRFYLAPRPDEKWGEEHDDRLYDKDELPKLTDAEIGEIPDDNKITAENVEEDFVALFDADTLIETILDGSGFEILKNRGTEEMGEGNLDPEVIEKVMDSMNDSATANGEQK